MKKGIDFDLYPIKVDGSDLERITFFDGFDGFQMFSPSGKYLVLHQVETKKKQEILTFFSRMELRMNKTLIILLLFTQTFSKNIENDVAYKRVIKELDGAVPVSFIEEAFSHEKLEIHKIIAERFAKPYEKKPWVEYKKIFVKESRVAAGAKFYNEYKKLIGDVSSKYGVDPFIIVTIAGVESNYGVHHSQYSVFNALYSQIHEIPRRSKWATKELSEFIKYCFKDQLDTQEIGGSYAGAFGYGQFIPSSFTRYSVDFNGNGVREPYSWPDVLGSIANYLRMNGYKKNSDNYQKDGDIYKSVYAYNHAHNYVMAVLELTEQIRERCIGSRKYYPSKISNFDLERAKMYKRKNWAPDKTINVDAWEEVSRPN